MGRDEADRSRQEAEHGAHAARVKAQAAKREAEQAEQDKRALEKEVDEAWSKEVAAKKAASDAETAKQAMETTLQQQFGLLGKFYHQMAIANARMQQCCQHVADHGVGGLPALESMTNSGSPADVAVTAMNFIGLRDRSRSPR